MQPQVLLLRQERRLLRNFMSQLPLKFPDFDSVDRGVLAEELNVALFRHPEQVALVFPLVSPLDLPLVSLAFPWVDS